MNKRTTRAAILLAFLLCVSVVLTGCTSAESIRDNGKPSIVCTAFPQYDWTLQILGGRAEEFNVILLNHQGTDMHSFQPTAENMVNMANCDLFIHIGGFSEGWVPAALESAGNTEAAVLTLLDHVDAKAEEFTEGMEHNHDHDHDHGHGHESEADEHEAEVNMHEEDIHVEDPHAGHDHEEDSHTEELDEHLWLSLRCAQDACEAITEAICQLDSANAADYQANADAYSQQLHELDHEYEHAVQEAGTKVLLFADRFPFRYLTDDYGIEYLAAFPGCSAETEASFETILYLSEEMDAHHLTCAIVLEGSKEDFAKTVISNTQADDPKILTLNSMQSVNQHHIDAGVTYLGIMKENLTVLKEALR